MGKGEDYLHFISSEWKADQPHLNSRISTFLETLHSETRAKRNNNSILDFNLEHGTNSGFQFSKIFKNEDF